MSVVLSNGHAVTRDKFVNFAVPEATTSYSPVSNYEFVETLYEQFDKLNYQVDKTTYLANKTGTKFAAEFVLKSENSDYNMLVAIKNSYDKSMSAGVAMGASVFVCANGAVSGEIAFTRRHSGQASKIVFDGVIEGLKGLNHSHGLIIADLEELKLRDLTKKRMAELAGRLFIQDEAIRAEQLTILKREIIKESFDYGVEDTMYNFYNAVTHSLKNSHPSEYLSNYTNIHNLLVHEDYN